MEDRFRLDFDVAAADLPMLFGLLTPHLMDPAAASKIELFTVNPAGRRGCPSVIVVTTDEALVGEIGNWASSGHLLHAADFIERCVRLLPPRQAGPMPVQITQIPITVPAAGAGYGARP